MKRSLLVGAICSLVILSGFAGCGNSSSVCGLQPDGGRGDDTLTPSAQACTDRMSIGFAREFGSGTYLGSSPLETIVIRNGGLADLKVSSATFTGDSAFKITTEPKDLPATIKGNQNFFVQVIFSPTEPKLYSGTLTVISDAEKSPSLEFAITGCGVPSDGGYSPCFRDCSIPADGGKSPCADAGTP